MTTLPQDPRPAAHDQSPLRAIGLGESLLRLSVPGHGRFQDTTGLEVHVGGSEMNVLIQLASEGWESTWITRLPDNPMAQRIVTHARGHGLRTVVDHDPTGRTPLYFVEHGLPPRPTEVVYDRAGSAMTRLDGDTFDWKHLVADHDVAVVSGITCGLSTTAPAGVAAFLTAARSQGVRTVLDVNHRARLGSWEEARAALRPLMPLVDVLSASSHDLHQLLRGAPAEHPDEGLGEQLAHEALASWDHDAVLTRRTLFPAPDTCNTQATVVTPSRTAVSRHHSASVLDAFGAGDAALGAFLARWAADPSDLDSAVEASSWAAAFHHTTPGDAWVGRPTDRAQTDGSPMIKR